MRKSDSIAFLENRKKYNLEIVDEGDRCISIALNFSTGLFYQTLAVLTEFENMEDENKITSINDLFMELIKYSDIHVNGKWLNNKISIESQINLIMAVSDDVSNILKNDCFVIPDIKEKQTANKKSNAEKERQNKKKTIKRLNKTLANRMDICLMNDIALLTAKTHNSYADIINISYRRSFLKIMSAFYISLPSKTSAVRPIIYA